MLLWFRGLWQIKEWCASGGGRLADHPDWVDAEKISKNKSHEFLVQRLLRVTIGLDLEDIWHGIKRKEDQQDMEVHQADSCEHYKLVGLANTHLVRISI